MPYQIHMPTSSSSSTTDEDFLTRYKDGRKLTDLLRQQQALGDSRVAQLKNELEVLRNAQQTLLDDGPDMATDDKTGDSDILVASKDPGIGSKNAGPEFRDSRFFDSQIFSTEIRVQQVQRQLTKNNTHINEVRTGVGHLMSLLIANAKLLHNLPKVKTPQLSNTDDILACLSWCEEVRTTYSQSCCSRRLSHVAPPPSNALPSA